MTGPLTVYGQGYTAALAIYAAILDPEITEVVLADVPSTHEDPQTPEGAADHIRTIGNIHDWRPQSN